MNIGAGYCKACTSEEETALHAMRDCSLVKTIWMHLVKLDARHTFFNCTLPDWIRLNLSSDLSPTHRHDWPEIWATACHSIWFWHNKLVHDADFLMPRKPWEDINSRVHNYNKAQPQRNIITGVARDCILVHWQAPNENWIKLNTDGASHKHCGVAGCGGLLRNSKGEWLTGYSKSLGYCDEYLAELWGILEGLQLIKRLGYQQVVVETDAVNIIQVLQKGGRGRAEGWRVMQQISKVISSSQWKVEFQHNYREANKAADLLAKIGCTQLVPLIVYRDTPHELTGILLDDSLGIPTPRMTVV